MKTVLAPNAPWPVRIEPKPKPVKQVKRVMPKPSQSKGKMIDANFERWLNSVTPIKKS